MTCRKAHAAAFNPFAVFLRADVQITGEVGRWESSPGYLRCFCTRCGSPVFAESGHEIEVSLGSFDEIGAFTPEYELWVIRRERWLPPLPIRQFDRNKA
jgi:hypothetical protein